VTFVVVLRAPLMRSYGCKIFPLFFLLVWRGFGAPNQKEKKRLDWVAFHPGRRPRRPGPGLLSCRLFEASERRTLTRWRGARFSSEDRWFSKLGAMRRLNGVEKSVVVLAAVFIIGGGIMAVWPVEMTYFPTRNYRVPIQRATTAGPLFKEGRSCPRFGQRR
jgi:hypothetical protein